MHHHPALNYKPTDVLLRTLGPSTSISLFTCDEASSQGPEAEAVHQSQELKFVLSLLCKR